VGASIESDLLWALGFGALAYLLGSVPFALLITRWRAGVDVRQVGSGHAGATNTMRAAGWGAGILVLLLDAAKGALAAAIPMLMGAPAWAMAIAGAAVVIGHCWPVFAGMRGGMGMASGAAALLVIWPFGFALALFGARQRPDRVVGGAIMAARRRGMGSGSGGRVGGGDHCRAGHQRLAPRLSGTLVGP